jgi:hypothetical protein
MTEESWLHFRRQQEVSFFSKTFRPALGSAYVSIQRVRAAVPPVIKRTVREIDPSLLSSGVAKNECSYTSNPSPYAILSCTWGVLLYRLKQYLRLQNILHVDALFKAFVK